MNSARYLGLPVLLTQPINYGALSVVVGHTCPENTSYEVDKGG